MFIEKPNNTILDSIVLTKSKSESNRALIIRALCNNSFEISSLATAKDTQTLAHILNTFKSNPHLDVGPAGTTFRFLTAFLSIQKGSWVLTGSKRMQERPIKILVDALNSIGAKITYLKSNGYPPLKIIGNGLQGNEIEIDGNISSQYISAILLISPSLSNGLTLIFSNECTSIPYVKMTLNMMEHFGIKSEWKENKIHVHSGSYIGKSYTIESDWSAASYWYEIIALSPNSQLELVGLMKNSLQGDAVVAKIFEQLGVKTVYKENSITLHHTGKIASTISLNMQDSPDLAQAIICTCAALGIEASISGLKTLRIKETDRTLALQKELIKFSIELNIINEDKVFLRGKQILSSPTTKIDTYEDHRMAMSFAPLALVTERLSFSDPEVVNKSYPEFWSDLSKVGFLISE